MTKSTISWAFIDEVSYAQDERYGSHTSRRRMDSLCSRYLFRIQSWHFEEVNIYARQEESVMAKDYTICIGTVGQGLWHSPDGGETWQRMRQPFPLESRVRALALHPTEAHTLFAGADSGVYHSGDNGASWERVSGPEYHLNMWSLAIDPSDPETIFASTSPSAVYRSEDGGQHWEQLPLDLAKECAIGTPRVTATVVDPDNPQIVWAGVEIDGVH